MNREDFENLFQLKTAVPQNWNISQIKSIVSTKITDGPHETPELEEAGVPFISAEAIKNDKIDFNLRRGFISEELHKQYSKKCKPQRNDIFIIKAGATTGNVAYVDVDFEFNIWSPLALVRCKEYLVYYKFLYYQLLSDIFRKQVELSWSFGTQENIGMRVIERLKAIIPNLPEQRRIASYLDKTCAAIDTAIEKKQKQLETLDALRKSIIHKAVTRGLGRPTALKDSGHEWLGPSPAKWKLIAIKRIVSTKITDGPHETPEFAEEGAQFISAEAIKNNKIDFDLRRGLISWELHEQYCRKCKPQRRDIFVVKSGATTGNVAYVDVDFEFSIWSPLALIRCDERIAFYKFIYYVLLTDVFRKQVELSWSFGTQQNIGMRVIERIKVPIPSLAEQREIAAFLDNETSNISAIRTNIESQIATLAVYRKSLIHECVTGKRRITEDDMKRVQQY